MKRFRQLADVARSNGDEEQAQGFESKIKLGREYLNQRESKLSPEQEKVRKKLAKNLTIAYDHLEAAGFTELVGHLRKHIIYETGSYRYAEDGAIEWSFALPLPEK
jgi:glutamine synthetase